MTQPLERMIIERARQLITDREHWVGVHFARDRSGRNCDPRDQRAVRFCAAGALCRAAHELIADDESAGRALAATYRYLTPLQRVTGLRLISTTDDDRERWAALELFDTALAKRKCTGPKKVLLSSPKTLEQVRR